MKQISCITDAIPAFSLYGESLEFPDVLHCEPISDRAHVHGWKIPPHRHLGLHQVFLVLEGQVALTLDGSFLDIEPGSAVVVPANCVHGFSFEKTPKDMFFRFLR